MIFPVGTKVQLRFTGETGTVVAQLGDGMVQVRLDSDWHSLIPAFEEDISLITVMNKWAAPPASAPAPPAPRVLKSSTGSAQPKGIMLVFEPMPGADEFVTRYKTWLMNDSATEFLFNLGIFIGDDKILGLEGKLTPWTIYEVGDLKSNDLNDGPEAELSVQRLTTAGPDDELFKLLKIKPKQFFKNQELIPIINTIAHYFVLFDRFDPVKEEQKSAADLKDYTKQVKGHSKRPASNTNASKYEVFNVEAFAHFTPEIDLHIQNLSKGYARLDKSEILRIQLVHFHTFMDKATRLGVHQVFIIHGVGEGKLKDAIAAELKRMPQVKKFKNEFHHKYGYGATEVIFE